jgi:hypothetical protein
VLHRRRATIDAHAPQHATIRVRGGLPTLRQPRFVRAAKRGRPVHRQAAPDPASSGRWLDGWRVDTGPPDPVDTREVAPARTWLLRTGWRRHGLIDPAEVPG